jgi:hypothetical protein
MVVTALILAALMGFAADPLYRSAWLDKAGQLHITIDSGAEITPDKLPGQTSFGDPAVAPDRRTVGWVVMYPDPTVTYYKGAELAGALVVYRRGHILHTFTTQPTLWDWQFQDGGKWIGYSTGPTHGGAAECVLRDVDSGRVLDHWSVEAGTEPPQWAKTLRR